MNVVESAVIVLVSSFTGTLGNWASDHADESYKLTNVESLCKYVRVSFCIEDLEGKNLYALTELKQNESNLHDYTLSFNNSYSYWKTDITERATADLYIGGLKNGALRAHLMTNWNSNKYID